MNSKRKSPSKVHIVAQNGPIGIQLFDHQLRPVASGNGELKAQVPAGLYMLQYNAGSAQKQEYIRVEADKPYENLSLDFRFPSAAPVFGSSSTHEYHTNPAAQLSNQPNQKYGTGGRLMIFVRSIDGDGKSPVNLDNLSVWGSELQPPRRLETEVVRDDQWGWAGLCAEVEPGAYALRWSETVKMREAQITDDTRKIDQALWVAKDWITIVFLAYDNQRMSINRQNASIHMARIEDGYQPYNSEKANQALELAMGSLRTGKAIVPDDLLDLLLNGKFHNPMLGIIGAHALLLQRKPNWKMFDTVINNLERMIPGHPDLTALRVLNKLARNKKGRLDVEPVRWPPMLYAAYRGLIAYDWQQQDIIPANSLAEQAAAQLLQQSPWTCWMALEVQKPRVVFPEIKIRDTSSTREISDPQNDALPISPSNGDTALAFDLQPSGENTAWIFDDAIPTNESATLSDPAVQQVSRYLDSLRQFEPGITLDNINRQRFSQIGLPVASVDRAIQYLKGITGPEV